MHSPLALVRVALLLLAHRAFAASLAVFPVEPRGVDVSALELAGLTGILSEEAGRLLGLEAKGPREIAAFLKARGLGFCIDRACQIEVEHGLRVEYSLSVAVLPLGSLCVLAATLYQRGTPASLRTAMIRGGCSADALEQSVGPLIAELAAPGPLVRASTLPPAPANVSAAGEETSSAPTRPRAFNLSLLALFAPVEGLLSASGEAIDFYSEPQSGGARVELDWAFSPNLFLGAEVDAAFGDWLVHLSQSVRLTSLWTAAGAVELGGTVALGAIEVMVRDRAGKHEYYGVQLGLRGVFHWRLRPPFGLKADLGGSLAWAARSRVDGGPTPVVTRIANPLRLDLGLGISYTF